MSLPALREVVGRLALQSQALAVLGHAVHARVSGVEIHPAVKPHVDAALAALGIDDLDALSPAELRPLLAELRVLALMGSKVLFGDPGTRGWSYNDPDLLRAAGETSAGFVIGLKNAVAPKLEGLLERLAAPGGAFLDVGVGIAGLAVAAAKMWPALRVVGIDVWAPSLAIARDNVREAGLEERIELREQSVDALSDRDRYDLAWLPALFIPDAVIPEALNRLHAAIRPGGWVLTAIGNPGVDPLTASLGRFRAAMWGSELFSLDDVQAAVVAAQFVEVKQIVLPGAPAAFVAGRKAE